MQVAPPLNEVPYDEHLSAVETEPPCAALSGLSAIWTLNPGLAPWAVLLDPFGVLGFAPETRLGCRQSGQRHAHSSPSTRFNISPSSATLALVRRVSSIATHI